MSADNDGDGSPDCVDPDDDNDGVDDTSDAFPFDPSESVDTDGDGIGNNADTDDDGDSQSDADETACGSDPLSAASMSADNDGDGSPDCVDPDDDNDGIADGSDACPLVSETFNGYLDGDGCPDTTVSIDIKPGSHPNSINPKSNGKITVAILSSSTFNATTQVNKASVKFGRTGSENSLWKCTGNEDVNGDGLLDVVCHFNTPQTGFVSGDTVGVLTGVAVGGLPFQGTDSVNIVPK
jgi:hypothetical protein